MFCKPSPGVTGQYHQPVGAKAQTRSPKSEGRKKPETRNARAWLRPSVFGLLSGFGLRNSDLGGWRRVVLSRYARHRPPPSPPIPPILPIPPISTPLAATTISCYVLPSGKPPA